MSPGPRSRALQRIPIPPRASLTMSPSQISLFVGQQSHVAALREYVERLLRIPLAAVQASLESLARQEPPGMRAAVLENIVRQLSQVQEAADLLCDECAPVDLRPERCSLEEIARSGLGWLHPERRARIWLALDEPAAHVVVDGPLLARSLARILDAALCDGSPELLFHSQLDGDHAWFTIVDELSITGPEGLERSAGGGGSRASATVALVRPEILVAARDIRRMGGSLEVLEAEGRRRGIVVVLPLGDRRREAA